MNYRELDDKKLLYMIKENDEESFNSLYLKYQPLVFTYANNNRYINQNICFEDILITAQEAFLNAVRTYDIEKSAGFRTYLHSCLKNNFTNFLRNKLAQKRNVYKNYSNKEEFDFENSSFLEDSITPLEIIMDIDFETNIIKFKNNFNDLESAIFDLRYNMFTLSEIATLLDISIKIVEGRLNKIKKVLKVYLIRLAK